MRFVNTRADGAGRVERFASAKDFETWATEEGLLDATAIVSDSDASAARELRDALVTVFLAHSQTPGVNDDEVNDAHRYLRHAGMRYPLAALITTQGAQLLPAAAGVSRALGMILARVTMLAQQGDWTRIKACSNPPCHAGFVDRTRNRSARYCSPGCGSQVSMRAFRQRQRRGSS